MIGGRLPATLRTDALPRELAGKLSPLDPGFERLLVVAGDVLCIELVNSRMMVDIMHNASAPAMQDWHQLLVNAGTDHATGAAGNS